MHTSNSPDPELPGKPPERPAPVMAPADPAEMAAALLAAQLAAQLERANFVVMRMAPQPPHGTG
jgi:hypothetical protein